jgi:hypothetical protein
MKGWGLGFQIMAGSFRFRIIGVVWLRGSLRSNG